MKNTRLKYIKRFAIIAAVVGIIIVITGCSSTTSTDQSTGASAPVQTQPSGVALWVSAGGPQRVQGYLGQAAEALGRVGDDATSLNSSAVLNDGNEVLSAATSMRAEAALCGDPALAAIISSTAGHLENIGNATKSAGFAIDSGDISAINSATETLKINNQSLIQDRLDLENWVANNV